MNRFCLPVVCAALFASASNAAEPYQDSVAPFVRAHCTKCHGPTKQSGDFRIDQLQAEPADAEKWQLVRQQLRDGLMPPAKEPKPDPKKTQDVVQWIETELAKAGKTVVKPQPQYGNEQAHDPLFDPANAKLPASTPARYWRLSPYIYKQYMVKQHPAGNNLVSPFNLLPGSGFKDYALPQAIDEPVAALLWLNAEALVSARFKIDPKTGKLDKPQYKEIGEAFDDTIPLTDARLAKIVTEEFRKVLGRVPTPTERDRWADQLNKNVAAGGRAVGVRMTLTVLYLHPEVVYRKEIGEGKPDAHGRRMLAPRELSYALAYALGDKAPDPALSKATDEGKLATRADAARELSRLFDDPKFEKPRIMRFFHEYFGYKNAVNVFKTDAPQGTHDASWSVADTDMLVADLLARDKNVLAELLTTQEIYLTTEPFFNKNSKPH